MSLCLCYVHEFLSFKEYKNTLYIQTDVFTVMQFSVLIMGWIFWGGQLLNSDRRNEVSILCY